MNATMTKASHPLTLLLTFAGMLSVPVVLALVWASIEGIVIWN